MSYPKIDPAPKGCFTATIDGMRTASYATREGALKRLCEMLSDKLAMTTKQLYPFKPTGPCKCGGWGEPTGCPGCGIRCMGG
jgi:hypothetical protein